jgi:hypothetical protein
VFVKPREILRDAAEEATEQHAGALPGGRFPVNNVVGYVSL